MMLLVMVMLVVFGVGQASPQARVARSTTVQNQPITDTTVQQTIVNMHNNYRANVDPASKAGNMQTMTWSATAAQAAADFLSCNNWVVHEHHADYGENLAGNNGGATGDLNGAATKAMEQWYSEESDYDFNANTCSAVCGHYTQVVWAQSNEVGCAYAKDCAGKSTTFAIHCYYKPPGNMNGLRPYVSAAEVLPQQPVIGDITFSGSQLEISFTRGKDKDGGETHTLLWEFTKSSPFAYFMRGAIGSGLSSPFTTNLVPDPAWTAPYTIKITLYVGAGGAGERDEKTQTI